MIPQISTSLAFPYRLHNLRGCLPRMPWMWAKHQERMLLLEHGQGQGKSSFLAARWLHLPAGQPRNSSSSLARRGMTSLLPLQGHDHNELLGTPQCQYLIKGVGLYGFMLSVCWHLTRLLLIKTSIVLVTQKFYNRRHQLGFFKSADHKQGADPGQNGKDLD
nr:PREDICTED: uncharacterized protein LOC107982435 isoform X2 [Anolis carolinensis]|eukprot:XP_016846961.1 PREDICTED: uncharacterized protein LOC107982435 isoform X2 [Anolis carolinensis]